MYNIWVYILFALSLFKTLIKGNEVTIQGTQEYNSLNNAIFKNYNDKHISAMINDYTLINHVTDSFSTSTNNMTTFSLQWYKEQDLTKNKMLKKNKNMLNDWVSYFIKLEEEIGETNEESRFESHVQTNLDSLNRVIINATDGLLNMCDRMIEKTTSVLPLSYSSYTQFETDMLLKELEVGKNLETEESGGLFGLFAKSKDKSKDEDKSKSIIVSSKEKEKKKEKEKEMIEDQVFQQMYDYQLYRLSIGNRDAFLNSLCSNTFEIPYILYYNSDINTLAFEFDPINVNYYTAIVQNVIDNSLIRGLNRGFKDQEDTRNNKREKDTNDKGGLKYDTELDIDKGKTASLKEKSKFILPILQKLSWKLPTYLSDTAKRSLTIDDYFHNLKQFWITILDQANIASHDSPITFKLERDSLRRLAEDKIRAQLRADQAAAEKLLASEQEAQQILDDYKKKALIDDARDFVRHSDILSKERKQNFSDKEWAQFNQKFSHHISGAIGIYDSIIGGLGQLIDSTLSIPANVIVNFASTQASQIGKLFILVAGVVIIGLMTLFFIKLFVRKVVKLFWNSDKGDKDV